MVEESISQESKLENVDETRNYLIEEIYRNELMSKKHNNALHNSTLYWRLSYLGSTVTGYISISAFASLVDIPIRVTSSAIGLNLSNNCRN